jgi:hypothetical protein
MREGLVSESDLNSHACDLRHLPIYSALEQEIAGQRHVVCGVCPRGDLNTETGAISPDRGNHAIRVTRAGRTHPVIPRRVRFYSATWHVPRCGGECRAA